MDYLITQVALHYVPAKYYPPIVIILTAWLMLEQWLAKTGLIKANSTLQAIDGFLTYIRDKIKGKDEGAA